MYRNPPASAAPPPRKGRQYGLFQPPIQDHHLPGACAPGRAGGVDGGVAAPAITATVFPTSTPVQVDLTQNSTRHKAPRVRSSPNPGVGFGARRLPDRRHACTPAADGKGAIATYRPGKLDRVPEYRRSLAPGSHGAADSRVCRIAASPAGKASNTVTPYPLQASSRPRREPAAPPTTAIRPFWSRLLVQPWSRSVGDVPFKELNPRSARPPDHGGTWSRWSRALPQMPGKGLVLAALNRRLSGGSP